MFLAERGGEKNVWVVFQARSDAKKALASAMSSWDLETRTTGVPLKGGNSIPAELDMKNALA